MLRFELLEKVVQGEAIAFVLSALGRTAIDCGLGCRLLFGAGRFVGLGLSGFTHCFAAGFTAAINADQRSSNCARDQQADAQRK